MHNPNYYRKDDIKIGDRVVVEKYLWTANDFYKDINGNLIRPCGTCAVSGIVIDIPNKYHCTVLCDQLHFCDCDNAVVLIKDKNRYKTSINFWKGGAGEEYFEYDEEEYYNR